MPRYKQPTQKQLAFVEYYTSPASDTYDNAMQSAIKAGYNKRYAQQHSHRYLVPIANKLTKRDEREKHLEGMSEKHKEMLQDAEKAIHDDLKIPNDAPPTLRSVRQKSSHFVAERLGKETYHTKNVNENHTFDNVSSNTLHTFAEQLLTATQEQNAQHKPQHVEHKDVTDDDHNASNASNEHDA